MGWPFNKRAEQGHAWGAITAGVAVLVSIPVILAAVTTNKMGFRWWWPTNWMFIPLAVTVVGILLLVVPVVRKPEVPQQLPPPQPSKTFSGGLVGEHSRLNIDSSADILAENTRFTGNATMNARHFPGRPDLLGQKVNHGGEEAVGSEEAGSPGYADGL